MVAVPGAGLVDDLPVDPLAAALEPPPDAISGKKRRWWPPLIIFVIIGALIGFPGLPLGRCSS